MMSKKAKLDFNLKKDISNDNILIQKPIFQEFKEFLRDKYDSILRRKYYRLKFKNFFKHQNYKIDLVLPSKGFSNFERKKKLDNISSIEGKDILIIGCGNGYDIFDWIKFQPRSITGLDILNYSRSWKKVLYSAKKKNINTKINFLQRDILKLKKSKKFHFIVSDAVFEHLQNFKEVLKKCDSLLYKKGIIYASYGPLWYNLGGDHFSNRNDDVDGFNHLLLNKKNYLRFFKENVKSLDEEIKLHGSAGIFVKKDLFSKLTGNQYMKIFLRNNFFSKYTVVEYCPISLKLLNKNYKLSKKLMKKTKFKILENFYLKTQVVYLKKVSN